SASALFGNASGGVISIWTDPTAPQSIRQDLRVLFGTFDRDLNRTWSKWQSSTAFRVGSGSGLVTVSRLDYTGRRQHSDADFRNVYSRWHFPLAKGWSLAATADLGWDPRADNPGALTAAEMARNTAGQVDPTVRTLDQLEHVTEVGPFVQSALQVTPHVSVTGGLRYDWVNFRADDRLVTASNPDDSGSRLMRALSGSVGVAVTP